MVELSEHKYSSAAVLFKKAQQMSIPFTRGDSSYEPTLKCSGYLFWWSVINVQNSKKWVLHYAISTIGFEKIAIPTVFYSFEYFLHSNSHFSSLGHSNSHFFSFLKLLIRYGYVLVRALGNPKRKYTAQRRLLIFKYFNKISNEFNVTP